MVFEDYSNLAKTAVMFARAEAGRLAAKVIDSEHLLLGTMRVDPTTVLAVAPALTLGAARERATTWQPPAASVPISVDMPLSDEGKRILDRASSLAKDRADALVRTEHLLLAMATEPCHAADILQAAGTDIQQVECPVADRLGAGQQERGDWSDEDLSEFFSQG